MESIEPLAHGTGDVEVEAMGTLVNGWIAAQLDQLTPEQREVVLLRIVADLTVESVAEVLGKGVGAVKASQRRAFRTLVRNIDRQTAPL